MVIVVNDFISEYTRIRNSNNINNVIATLKILSICYNIDYEDLYNYYIDMVNLYKDDIDKINKLIENYIKDNGIVSIQMNITQLIQLTKVFLEFNHTIKTSTIINKVCELLQFNTEIIKYMNDSLEIGSETYINSLRYRLNVTELFKTIIDSDTEIEELQKQKRWFEINRFEGIMMVCAYQLYIDNNNDINNNNNNDNNDINNNDNNDNNDNDNDNNKDINNNINNNNDKLKSFEFKDIFSYIYNWIFDIFDQIYDYSYSIISKK